MDRKLGRLIAVSFAAMVSVAGCASMEADKGPDLTQMIGDMYVGRPVQDLATRYGVPDSQQDFQGEHVYSWHASADRQWRRPVTSTTTGVVGDPSRGAWATVPYSQTTTSQATETTHYECRMDVYVKPDGTVRTLGLYGKMGACELFDPRR